MAEREEVSKVPDEFSDLSSPEYESLVGLVKEYADYATRERRHRGIIDRLMGKPVKEVKRPAKENLETINMLARLPHENTAAQVIGVVGDAVNSSRTETAFQKAMGDVYGNAYRGQLYTGDPQKDEDIRKTMRFAHLTARLFWQAKTKRS